MTKIKIVTDSCSDIPLPYAVEKELGIVPLTFILNDKTYDDDLGKSLSYEDFFNAIEAGAMPKTSQPTPDKFYQVFKQAVEDGHEVLYVGVSKGLSGTFNSANIGKKMVLEEYPNATIHCLTTRTGCMGQTLFVRKAVEMKEAGKSLTEIVELLDKKTESNKTLIMINDLSYLKRGGRLTGVQATIGTILKITPILGVDKEGKIEITDKIRGKKKSLKHLVEFVQTNCQNPETQTLAICHANNLEDAEALKNEILKATPFKDVLIGSIGPTIGSYSGVGTLAVFFLN